MVSFAPHALVAITVQLLVFHVYFVQLATIPMPTVKFYVQDALRDNILPTQKENKNLPPHVYIFVPKVRLPVKLVRHPKLLASLVQRVNSIPKKDK